MNIVITGGSSGLGKALVELCAATADNHVVFTYCRHKDNALALTEQFNNVEAIAVDFSLTDQVESLAERLADMQVDILVNNAYAGHAQGVHFHKTAPEDFANACHTYDKNNSGLYQGNAQAKVRQNHQHHHGLRHRRTSYRFLCIYGNKGLYPTVVEEHQ